MGNCCKTIEVRIVPVPEPFVNSDMAICWMKCEIKNYLVPGIEGIIAGYIPRTVECCARGCYAIADNQPVCKRCKRSYCIKHLGEKLCDNGYDCATCAPLGMYLCALHGLECPHLHYPIPYEARKLLERWQAYGQTPCRFEYNIVARENLVVTLRDMYWKGSCQVPYRKP